MASHQGRIEVICGSMFSGKTEELIRRLRRAQIARQHVQVFKPRLDDRYGVERVTSHNGMHLDAMPVDSSTDILSSLDANTTVVGIDEVQFFDVDIVQVCRRLADADKRVIVAGLDLDFKAEPFGAVPELLAQAEMVDKVRAICVVCGEEASRTQRLVNGKPAASDDPVVVIGASESYEARCRQCHRIAPPQRVDQG
ncbi:MAG: thymidine kinase [Chloroflexota bacterium]